MGTEKAEEGQSEGRQRLNILESWHGGVESAQTLQPEGLASNPGSAE